jgi:hypothetical protein
VLVAMVHLAELRLTVSELAALQAAHVSVQAMVCEAVTPGAAPAGAQKPLKKQLRAAAGSAVASGGVSDGGSTLLQAVPKQSPAPVAAASNSMPAPAVASGPAGLQPPPQLHLPGNAAAAAVGVGPSTAPALGLAAISGDGSRGGECEQDGGSQVHLPPALRDVLEQGVSSWAHAYHLPQLSAALAAAGKLQPDDLGVEDGIKNVGPSAGSCSEETDDAAVSGGGVAGDRWWLVAPVAVDNGRSGAQGSSGRVSRPGFEPPMVCGVIDWDVLLRLAHGAVPVADLLAAAHTTPLSGSKGSSTPATNSRPATQPDVSMAAHGAVPLATAGGVSNATGAATHDQAVQGPQTSPPSPQALEEVDALLRGRILTPAHVIANEYRDRYVYLAPAANVVLPARSPAVSGTCNSSASVEAVSAPAAGVGAQPGVVSERPSVVSEHAHATPQVIPLSLDSVMPPARSTTVQGRQQQRTAKQQQQQQQQRVSNSGGSGADVGGEPGVAGVTCTQPLLPPPRVTYRAFLQT